MENLETKMGLSVSDWICLKFNGVSNRGIYFIEEMDINLVGTNSLLSFTNIYIVLRAVKNEEHSLRKENSFLVALDSCECD